MYPGMCITKLYPSPSPSPLQAPWLFIRRWLCKVLGKEKGLLKMAAIITDCLFSQLSPHRHLALMDNILQSHFWHHVIIKWIVLHWSMYSTLYIRHMIYTVKQTRTNQGGEKSLCQRQELKFSGKEIYWIKLPDTEYELTYMYAHGTK